MTENNVLMSVNVKISCNEDGPIKPATELTNALKDEDILYSYIVKANYKDGKIESFTANIRISQTERYNTICKQEAILDIVELLSKEYSESVKVVGYKQPPLELLVEIFDPLVNKIASKQHQLWNIEYDDLAQMCRLSMCVLYNKGYYIHKSLLNTVFIRDVLGYLRKERNKPTMISLDGITESEDNPLQVEDEDAQIAMFAYEEEEAKRYELEQRRKIAIDHYGQRRYDQLMRGMISGTLTHSDRVQMSRNSQRLKRKIKHDE